MGVFGKKRIGTVRKLNSGRCFEWEIPHIFSFPPPSTLDSPLETHYAGARFHFHLFISSNDCIGVYIHFKSPPIPKYSYYFRNSKQEIMRQQTAHSIPTGVERVGHPNICSRRDLREFITDTVGSLLIVFVFDEDKIETLDPLTPAPLLVNDVVNTVVIQNVGMATQSNREATCENSEALLPRGNTLETIQVLWRIPEFKERCIWPYTSRNFGVGSIDLIARIDVRRHSTTSCIAIDDYNDIDSIIVFIFARGKDIPSHSIELVKGSSLPACTEAYAAAPPKPPGMAQGLLVSRNVLDTFFSEQQSKGEKSSDLFVRFTFIKEENPLAQLSSRFYPPALTSDALENVIPPQQHRIKTRPEDVMDKKYTLIED